MSREIRRRYGSRMDNRIAGTQGWVDRRTVEKKPGGVGRGIATQRGCVTISVRYSPLSNIWCFQMDPKVRFVRWIWVLVLVRSVSIL